MGRRKKSVHTLTLGHTHQLPFVVFGLGQTPSLIEKMEVSVLVYCRERKSYFGDLMILGQATNLETRQYYMYVYFCDVKLAVCCQI